MLSLHNLDLMLSKGPECHLLWIVRILDGFQQALDVDGPVAVIFCLFSFLNARQILVFQYFTAFLAGQVDDADYIFVLYPHAEVFASETCWGWEEFLHLLLSLALNIDQEHFEIVPQESLLRLSVLLNMQSHELHFLLKSDLIVLRFFIFFTWTWIVFTLATLFGYAQIIFVLLAIVIRNWHKSLFLHVTRHEAQRFEFDFGTIHKIPVILEVSKKHLFVLPLVREHIANNLAFTVLFKHYYFECIVVLELFLVLELVDYKDARLLSGLHNSSSHW